MKIGVLTLPLVNNYGGILQAYALQSFLRDAGYDVEVIQQIRPARYRSDFTQLIDKLTFGLRPIKLQNGDIISRKKWLRLLEEVSSEPKRFINERLCLSEKLYVEGDLDDVNRLGFDVVVVGSDQVWRRDYVSKIQSYFLDFLDNSQTRKVAYAASFGTADWQYDEKVTAECKNLLKSFKSVSVREKSAVSMCHKYLGITPFLAVDPTLLVDPKHYVKLSGAHPKERHLCSYVLDESDMLAAEVNRIADDHSLKIVSPMPKNKFTKAGESKLNDCKFGTVEDWVSAFHQADYVITDSFHGTVFSILFNKPFISYVNRQRGASRFESLLGELGLSSRMVYCLEELKSVGLDGNEIDWTAVNKFLSQWRRKSRDFLIESLRSEC